jgi:hypothetical protein
MLVVSIIYRTNKIETRIHIIMKNINKGGVNI